MSYPDFKFIARIQSLLRTNKVYSEIFVFFFFTSHVYAYPANALGEITTLELRTQFFNCRNLKLK